MLALSLLSGAPLFAQQPVPAFAQLPGGIVTAVLPPQILHDRSVRRHLDSGLTTTFLLLARHPGGEGGARLEVRYDLWDEVWIVRRVDLDRTVDHQRLSSLEALDRWWRTPLRIVRTDASKVALDLHLAVLPFSAAEAEDARQWIAKSGGVGTSAGSGGAIVDALIGTTLSAKPITSFRWRIEVTLR
jgi:hypothetical protein